MSKKLLAITLSCTLILSSATLALADDKVKGRENRNKVNTKQEKTITEDQENEELEISEEANEEANEEIEKGKGWKELKNKLEQDKDEVEAQKDELEIHKDELEKKYEEAKNSEDNELAEELNQQIQELKGQMEELKLDMKSIMIKRKEVVRNKYTEDELEKIEEAKEEMLEEGEAIKVLDVDSILSKKANMKFDTPPVIKGGRTLVPVRAIVEGFGAEVEWNEETREVTVIKDDVEIILPIDNNEVYVNGEKIDLDTKSEIMNSRTYVPLRFIAENLGLKVDWDEETETIELDEDEEDTESDEVVEEEEDINNEDKEAQDENEDATDVDDTTDEEAINEDDEDLADTDTEEASDDSTENTTEETTDEDTTEDPTQDDMQDDTQDTTQDDTADTETDEEVE